MTLFAPLSTTKTHSRLPSITQRAFRNSARRVPARMCAGSRGVVSCCIVRVCDCGAREHATEKGSSDGRERQHQRVCEHARSLRGGLQDAAVQSGSRGIKRSCSGTSARCLAKDALRGIFGADAEATGKAHQAAQGTASSAAEESPLNRLLNPELGASSPPPLAPSCGRAASANWGVMCST